MRKKEWEDEEEKEVRGGGSAWRWWQSVSEASHSFWRVGDEHERWVASSPRVTRSQSGVKGH